MKTPLEYGEVLKCSVSYDEFTERTRHSFEAPIALVYQEKAHTMLSRDLKDCASCPMCKAETRHDKDHARLETVITAYAKCASNPDAPCPMKAEPDKYLSAGEMPAPDWLKDAEADAEGSKRIFVTPRGRGKSAMIEDSVITSVDGIPDWAKKSAEADIKRGVDDFVATSTIDGSKRIRGARADVMYADEISQYDEEDLDEAVDFETNRENYDNFGSW